MKCYLFFWNAINKLIDWLIDSNVQSIIHFPHSMLQSSFLLSIIHIISLQHLPASMIFSSNYATSSSNLSKYHVRVHFIHRASNTMIVTCKQNKPAHRICPNWRRHLHQFYLPSSWLQQLRRLQPRLVRPAEASLQQHCQHSFQQITNLWWSLKIRLKCNL